MTEKIDLLYEWDLSPWPRMFRVYSLEKKKTTRPLIVIGGWIFDSRSEHALPLTKKNLDWCSLDGRNCRIRDGYQFSEGGRKQERLIDRVLIDVLPAELGYIVNDLQVLEI